MTIFGQDELQNQESPVRTRDFRIAVLLLMAVAMGLAGGYMLWGRGETNGLNERAGSVEGQPTAQSVIKLPEQYTVPAAFGSIGPRLLEMGAIDLELFVQIYRQSGQPLTDEQLRILADGGDMSITIDRKNAYFLLNLLWAFGLTNQNPILETGPLTQNSQGRIEVYASTGGWTVGSLSAGELYDSTALVTLTPAQQERLEEVAYTVYRPCCNNHTAFADCNHGMAMLGLLELMAAQDATVDEMYEAAKNVSAFWFPQQVAELAIFFNASRGEDFVDVDSRDAVGRYYFSSAGYQAVHQWLVTNDLLERTRDGGSSCGV